MSAVNPTAQRIVQFWFAGGTRGETFVRSQTKLWFSGGPAEDEALRREFGSVVTDLKSGHLLEWKENPREALAAILACDQFTRSIYRGKAEQFDLDPIALEFAHRLIDTGQYGELDPVERVFVLMVLNHSESLTEQQLCCQLFTELHQELLEQFGKENALVQWTGAMVRFAHMHREMIGKYGRFPHRNAVLGRSNTAAEEQGFQDGTIHNFFHK